MSVKRYETYIREQADEYIKKQKINIVQLPQENFYNVIDRAINKETPFFGGKGTIEINGEKQGGKEFSDAGFKDAIFLESIIQFNKFKRSNILILTKDHILLEKLNWKTELNRDNIIVKDIDQGIALVKYICKIEDIRDFSEYRKFCKTDYYKDIIYNAINKKVTKIIEINEEVEEDLNYIDIISIVKGETSEKKVTIRINEEKEFIEIFDENGEVIYEW